MHPPFVAMLAVADGTSVMTENLYDSRFRYIGELARMGADISREWQHAVIRASSPCRDVLCKLRTFVPAQRLCLLA